MTKLWGTLLIALICMCIIVQASALVPDDVRFNSSKRWVVANGYDTAVMTVEAYNTSESQPINNSFVTFSVNNSVYGIIGASAQTVNGIAQTTFTTRYKSGTALITANISYRINESDLNEPLKYVEKPLSQYIDHSIPTKIPSGGIILPPQGEATVGTETEIGILMQDAHGNPIDNRREVDEARPSEAEKVLYSVTGSPGAPDSTASFLPGNLINITIMVNETGWTTTPLALDIRPGPNIIKIDPQTSVPDLKRTIIGVPDRIPHSITSTISTSDGFERDYVLADGIQKFYILYQLTDEFGNGVQLKDVRISTDLGESFIATTNATGAIGIDYGPKSFVRDIIINATSLQNTSVTKEDVIRFVNLTADDLLLTAAPQSMASYDARPEFAHLYGYIIDTEGNLVLPGEEINFTIARIWYDKTPYDPLVIENSSLGDGVVSGRTSLTVSTGANGYALVYLKPATFSIDEFADGYDSTSTGHCEVVADWTNPNGTPVHRSIIFTFKNYPYLSAETSVSPTRVNVTDTVNVTLILRGDGFALLPKPIDVMLVVDRSGSMGWDLDGSQTRLQALKTAATNFVNQMNSTTDRVGLLPYSTEIYTYRYRQLGTEFETVKYQISRLSADGWTASRLALKESVVRMNQVPNNDPRTIRAIIFMTDGEFNYYGDPLARGQGYSSTYAWTTTYIDRHRWFSGLGGTYGSGTYDNTITDQNMSVYARNNHYRVYTISFSPDIIEGGDTWNVMENLANHTGGKHFHAESAQELYDVYEQIAGELKTAAGVNTTVDLDFENIQVKNVTVPGAEVFNYEYSDGISTYIKRWVSGSDPWYQNTINQTQEWNDYHQLDFDVGTIEIQDNWQATFSLRVLQDGDISVFGANSIITFDGNSTLKVPDTIISAVANLRDEEFAYAEFHESDIQVTQISQTIYEWTWERLYTGGQQVQEYYFISIDGGYQWSLVGDKLLEHYEAGPQSTGYFRYDIRNLLPQGYDLSGVTVDFRIKAYAIDAASPRTPRGPQIVRVPSNTTYISLQ